MAGARAVAPWDTPQTHPSTAGPASSVHRRAAQSNPWGQPGRGAIQEPPTHRADTLVYKPMCAWGPRSRAPKLRGWYFEARQQHLGSHLLVIRPRPFPLSNFAFMYLTLSEGAQEIW